MLHATLHLFLLPGVKRTRIRAAEIAAHATGHGDASRIVVAAFRAGKAFAGALKLAGKAALVALVDWRVGPVIRHVLIAVIPHVFQRLQVVLNVRVLAVADEAAAGDRWIRCFKVDLVVRVHLFLHVEVEAVGVIPFVGHAFHNPELGGVQTAEAVAQVLARGAVEAKPVAGFLFPLVNRVAQALNDGDAFFAQGLAVVHMRIARQCVDGLVNTDVAQRNRRATVFEDLRHVIVRFQTHSAGPFHIEDRRDAGFDPFKARNAGHQRLTRQLQTFIQQRPEFRFIAFRLQRDARQVQADDAQVVAPVVDLLAVFIFVHAEEAAAAHWRFKRTGHFDDLIVVQDVRVHALARALQRQLFDVVVRIAKLVVQAVANGKDQFREHRRFAVLAEAGNAVAQDGLLDQA